MSQYTASDLETTMSKTNDSSNLTTLEDYRPLADSELDAVTGGTAPKLSAATCTGTHIRDVVIEMR